MLLNRVISTSSARGKRAEAAWKMLQLSMQDNEDEDVAEDKDVDEDDDEEEDSQDAD